MSSIINPKDQFFARNMRYSDVDLVVSNETLAYKYPWTKQNFIDCLQSGYQCWVLADKQQIIAHGVISIAICDAHLLTLCVHPQFQHPTSSLLSFYRFQSARCECVGNLGYGPPPNGQTSSFGNFTPRDRKAHV